MFSFICNILSLFQNTSWLFFRYQVYFRTFLLLLFFMFFKFLGWFLGICVLKFMEGKHLNFNVFLHLKILSFQFLLLIDHLQEIFIQSRQIHQVFFRVEITTQLSELFDSLRILFKLLLLAQNQFILLHIICSQLVYKIAQRPHFRLIQLLFQKFV